MIHLVKKGNEAQVVSHFEGLHIDGVGYETTTPKVVWHKEAPIVPDATVSARYQGWEEEPGTEIFSFTYPNGQVRRYLENEVYEEDGIQLIDVDLVNGSTFNSSLYYQFGIADGDGQGATAEPMDIFQDGDTFTLPTTQSGGYYAQVWK